MKKLISLFLTLILVFSFASCNKKQNSNQEPQESNNTSVSAIEYNEETKENEQEKETLTENEQKEEIFTDKEEKEIAQNNDSYKIDVPTDANTQDNEDTTNKQEDPVKAEEQQSAKEDQTKDPDANTEGKEPPKTTPLPTEINGIASSNLLKAFALPDDLCYTNDPQSENEHINNFLYCYLTGNWEFIGPKFTSSWKKNIGPLVDKNITLLGAFQNQSDAKVVYTDGKYYISSRLNNPSAIKEQLYQEIFGSYNKALTIKNIVHEHHNFTSSTSQYQIAEYYYDYLDKEGFTVDNFDNSDRNNNIQRDSAYASLVNKNGSCGARAAAYCMLLNLESIKTCGLKEDTWQNGAIISGHLVSYIVVDNEEWSVDWGNQRGIYKWNAPTKRFETEFTTVLTSLETAREATGFVGEDLNIERTDYSLPATKATVGVSFELTFMHNNDDGSEVYNIKAVESGNYDENSKYQPWFGNTLGMGTPLNNPISLETFKSGMTVTIRKNSIEFYRDNNYPKTIYVMQVTEN